VAHWESLSTLWDCWAQISVPRDAVEVGFHGEPMPAALSHYLHKFIITFLKTHIGSLRLPP
jgi:hypothetical protein